MSSAGAGAPAAAFAGVAVLVPCHNEEVAVAQVVRDFSTHLPGCAVYVCDNASTDRTAAVARDAGARVLTERLKGKGNAVRRLFAEAEAEVFLLVDGDATYDAASAPAMVRLLRADALDMVNARRVADRTGAYRPGHRFGNRLLSGCVRLVFGDRIQDLLSGYRVFSRRFVKSFPAMSHGFEIETELTVHALELRVPLAELDTPYFERPEGSASKLRTMRDGWRILRTIAALARDERPLAVFGAAAALLVFVSIGISVPIFVTYAQTGLVPRLPTAVLAVGLVVLGCLSLVCGLVLDTVTLGRREMKRLAYLALPGPTG